MLTKADGNGLIWYSKRKSYKLTNIEDDKRMKDEKISRYLSGNLLLTLLKPLIIL